MEHQIDPLREVAPGSGLNGQGMHSKNVGAVRWNRAAGKGREGERRSKALDAAIGIDALHGC